VSASYVSRLQSGGLLAGHDVVRGIDLAYAGVSLILHPADPGVSGL